MVRVFFKTKKINKIADFILTVCKKRTSEINQLVETFDLEIVFFICLFILKGLADQP